MATMLGRTITMKIVDKIEPKLFDHEFAKEVADMLTESEQIREDAWTYKAVQLENHSIVEIYNENGEYIGTL